MISGNAGTVLLHDKKKTSLKDANHEHTKQ